MTVKIAMVGLGWWGQKMVDVLQAAPNDITVVRAVEPNLDAVKNFAREKGLFVTASYQDALNDPEVDAVVLATGNEEVRCEGL